MSYIVIAHNIRSAHNIGSIFRTADGCGVEKIFLTGYTPTPATKETVYLTRAHKDFAKTALGAEKNMAWEYQEDVMEPISQLKAKQYQIIALEQDERSINYRRYQPMLNVALFIGNEVDGVDAEVLQRADGIIEIPMRGQKNSLNVSVAFGIAAFEIKSKMEVYEKN